MSFDPHINLATDEFLLKERAGAVVRLWRDEPCVVLGRHQNPFEEAHLAEVRQRGLPLLRRLSGGGTVYHDLGNINFTAILPVDELRLVDFRRVLDPLVRALQRLGVDVALKGRSDLTLHGLKVSGNAIYNWQGRCLHHGTLLYGADLEALEAVLDVRPADVRSRAIKSIRSRVTNIRDHLPAPPPVAQFMDALLPLFVEELGLTPGEVAANTALTDADRARIVAIADATYRTWEWTYGRTPRFEVTETLPAAPGHPAARLELVVEHGIVTQARVDGGNAQQQAEAARRIGRRYGD